MSWLSKKVTQNSNELGEDSASTSGFELSENELEKESNDKRSSASDIENKNMNLVEVEKNGFKLQLIHKLNEIDKSYKRGLLEYKENIEAYNIEIEKLKHEIALESEYCEKEEKKLLMFEHELLFENKIYDKLQVKFLGFVNSIEELNGEYKDVLDAKHYAATLKRKEKELFECLDDIEVAELALLNKELERLNILESFEPKQMQLKRVEIALKELEMEKIHFESMGLHKVSNVQVDKKDFWKEKSTEIVDTIEIESDK